MLWKPVLYEGRGEEEGVFQSSMPENTCWWSQPSPKPAGEAEPRVSLPQLEAVRNLLELPLERLQPGKKTVTLWLKLCEGNRKNKAKQVGCGFAHP